MRCEKVMSENVNVPIVQERENIPIDQPNESDQSSDSGIVI